MVKGPLTLASHVWKNCRVASMLTVGPVALNKKWPPSLHTGLHQSCRCSCTTHTR